MEGIRVRLVFENGNILSKSQRSEGLNRSWLLLQPQRLQTISDLSSYLLHFFDLHHSCPNGVLLSMDGFVLPPFESTCILKDKDIIRVKKKGGSLLDITEVGDAANSVEEVDIVEKQPLHAGVPLLANEEFEKETRGYLSEPEDYEDDQLEDILTVENSSHSNAVSKKRKASKKLQNSKKKKHRSVVSDGVEDEALTEQIERCHNGGVLPCKRLHKKEKVIDVKSKPNMEITPEIAERSNNNVDSTPCIKRSDQLQENDEGIEDVYHMPEGTKKVPSRSARRKKSKRKWLREVAKAEKKDVVCHSKGLLHLKQEKGKAEKKEVVSQPKGLLHGKKLPEKDVHKDIIEPNQNSDAEDDVVPIVIRPGHIRFEPLEKDQAAKQSQVSVDNFQWNGITSKKKGQKWGKEKFSSAQRNDYNDLNKEEHSEMLAIENKIPVNDPINFDKLPLLTNLPKEGDVIAYRLLELSSSWTPELSSFRVGKISWYDPESSRVMLMPVPEHPIISEKLDEDDSTTQPDNSLYREDGNLEIEFSSLVDVRIVKHSDSDPAKAAAGKVNEVLPAMAANKDALSSLVPSNNNDKQMHTPTRENGEVNLWDHFSSTLNAKKAQLSEENDWSKGSSGKSSWSYKALRSSALGPTMAILRSKKDI